MINATNWLSGLSQTDHRQPAIHLDGKFEAN
uniref:Uncharacterized protein n=1 Tax=Pseudomonas aeruginosa TaxID=287 RepID=B3G1X5_PSEAI|nr:hypothetical protein PACL_0249 [Pseudomonas aeruginosa]